jgi:hypothetical protein
MTSPSFQAAPKDLMVQFAMNSDAHLLRWQSKRMIYGIRVLYNLYSVVLQDSSRFCVYDMQGIVGLRCRTVISVISVIRAPHISNALLR